MTASILTMTFLLKLRFILMLLPGCAVNMFTGNVVNEWFSISDKNVTNSCIKLCIVN